MGRVEYDIIIENGRVIDGTGNPWIRADVGIVGDTIETVGRIKNGAKRRIDATGLVVSPGFIDIHSHSGISVLVDPFVQSKIRQGVTTEVVGNCGESPAPMNEKVRAYREKYARNRVPEDFEFNWETMKDYLDLVEEKGASFNLVSLVGHGTIRQNVMGHDDREPEEEELEEMRLMVSEAMEQGAWGMSTGLIYPPSVYATTDELIELAKVVAKNNGIYASHIRGEGEELIEAIREAIRIGRESGAPVEIAHFKASGKPFWGKTKQALKVVEGARDRGIDVTYDQYPYIASSTNLTALLPHWAHEGGPEKMIQRIEDKEARERMKEEQRITRDWSSVMVVHAKKHPGYTGKNLEEIAEFEDKTPFNAMCDLLIEEEMQVPAVMFGMSEDDVRRVMRNPIGMVGSDGSAVSPEGVLGQGKPHPRYYGTFPRVLGHYVREGVITLQEAVRKMTSAPAQRLGIRHRGLLREGFKADITIFDAENIKDEATFTEPHRYPAGIPYVLVNGKIVIDDTEHTGALPGKILIKTFS